LRYDNVVNCKNVQKHILHPTIKKFFGSGNTVEISDVECSEASISSRALFSL